MEPTITTDQEIHSQREMLTRLHFLESEIRWLVRIQEQLEAAVCNGQEITDNTARSWFLSRMLNGH